MIATGSPVGVFALAVLTVLRADATLTAFASGGIYAALKTGTKTPFPYVVLSRRGMNPGGAGAMQREGGTVFVVADVWSDKNSPNEVEQIQARIRYLLQRETLRLDGFTMIAHSLECDEELVIPDFDPDMPARSLFHGVQHWRALVEEAG